MDVVPFLVIGEVEVSLVAWECCLRSGLFRLGSAKGIAESWGHSCLFILCVLALCGPGPCQAEGTMWGEAGPVLPTEARVFPGLLEPRAEPRHLHCVPEPWGFGPW